MRVLDIAAGHGLFGVEIANRIHSACDRADWARSSRGARNAKKAGVHERYNMLPAVPLKWTTAARTTLCCLPIFCTTSMCHQCGLLKKVRASLKPGGEPLRLSSCPMRTRLATRACCIQHDHAHNYAAGDAYTMSELTAMYADAGFKNVTGHPIPMSPHTVVLERPERAAIPLI